jgi:hypothetical protein
MQRAAQFCIPDGVCRQAVIRWLTPLTLREFGVATPKQHTNIRSCDTRKGFNCLRNALLYAVLAAGTQGLQTAADWLIVWNK